MLGEFSVNNSCLSRNDLGSNQTCDEKDLFFFWKDTGLKTADMSACEKSLKLKAGAVMHKGSDICHFHN